MSICPRDESPEMAAVIQSMKRGSRRTMTHRVTPPVFMQPESLMVPVSTTGTAFAFGFANAHFSAAKV